MKSLTRRRLIKTALISTAGAAGLGLAGRIAKKTGFLAPDYWYEPPLGVGDALTYGAQRLLTTAGHSMAREFRSSEISRVSPVNHAHPRYDPYLRLLYDDFRDWRFYVDGLVARPASFSLAELKALPSRTQITQLTCEEGWTYIAAWTGVPVASLLGLVGASPQAKWVVFYPFDDFWGSIDMAEAMHPQTILAYGMNGEGLSANHGAPIRLRVPRQLGYKNLKFIARMRVVSSLDDIGTGYGSGAPDLDYSWYAGI
jgi:DMSO/TMAO reductase YedYZ molybdopterin-dependent catalytic subunit